MIGASRTQGVGAPSPPVSTPRGEGAPTPWSPARFRQSDRRNRIRAGSRPVRIATRMTQSSDPLPVGLCDQILHLAREAGDLVASETGAAVEAIGSRHQSSVVVVVAHPSLRDQAVSAHHGYRQANAGPRPHAGQRPREPRVQRQTRRLDRGLPRPRRSAQAGARHLHRERRPGQPDLRHETGHHRDARETRHRLR